MNLNASFLDKQYLNLRSAKPGFSKLMALTGLMTQDVRVRSCLMGRPESLERFSLGGVRVVQALPGMLVANFGRIAGAHKGCGYEAPAVSATAHFLLRATVEEFFLHESVERISSKSQYSPCVQLLQNTFPIDDRKTLPLPEVCVHLGDVVFVWKSLGQGPAVENALRASLEAGYPISYYRSSAFND